MKIEMEDGRRLVDAIVQEILYGENGNQDRIETEVRKRVREHIDNMVITQVESTIEREVRERIVAVLDGGWQKTTSWGDASGPPMTLRAKIVEALNAEVGDYSRRENFLAKVIKEQLTAELHGELGKELKRAQEQIRAAVDGLIKEKLTETLRSALGLGR